MQSTTTLDSCILRYSATEGLVQRALQIYNMVIPSCSVNLPQTSSCALSFTAVSSKPPIRRYVWIHCFLTFTMVRLRPLVSSQIRARGVGPGQVWREGRGASGTRKCPSPTYFEKDIRSSIDNIAETLSMARGKCV